MGVVDNNKIRNFLDKDCGELLSNNLDIRINYWVFYLIARHYLERGDLWGKLEINRQIIPILIKTSARLKTGKLINLKSRKSTT